MIQLLYLHNLYMISALILVLFWLITYIYYTTIKSYINLDSSKTYECGFYSLNNDYISIKLNSIKSISLILLYEFEIILLLPFITQKTLNFTYNTTVILLVIIIVLTLKFDLFKSKLNWVFIC